MTASQRQVGGGHYQKLAIQPSEFIHRNGIGWCESNVIKYVCRHRSKNGRQDIEKAIHYLQLLLEWEYPDAPPTVCAAATADNPVRDVPDGVVSERGLYRDMPRPCAACEED